MRTPGDTIFSIVGKANGPGGWYLSHPGDKSGVLLLPLLFITGDGFPWWGGTQNKGGTLRKNIWCEPMGLLCVGLKSTFFPPKVTVLDVMDRALKERTSENA